MLHLKSTLCSWPFLPLQGKAFWATEEIDAQSYIFDILNTGRRKCFRRPTVEAQRLGFEKIKATFNVRGGPSKVNSRPTCVTWATKLFVAHTMLWAAISVSVAHVVLGPRKFASPICCVMLLWGRDSCFRGPCHTRAAKLFVALILFVLRFMFSWPMSY